MSKRLPQRIVCLTTETVEVLYAIGEQERIVGISGYTVHPPRARKEKPKVFAFTSGDSEKILAVQPVLVLTFSNLQADIARDLIQAGVAVHAFNPVSYTHLDVYKRQAFDCAQAVARTMAFSSASSGMLSQFGLLQDVNNCASIPARNASPEPIGLMTVSYTHLDVYKRQTLK